MFFTTAFLPYFAVVVAGVKFFPLFLCPLFTFVVGGGGFLKKGN